MTYYEDESITLHQGDVLDVLKGYADDSFHSIVTDPPYELKFMGKDWDGVGVSFRPETWAEVLRVLKPGGHLLAFGGSRTHHRMAVAIEDAGFEIRDTIMWLYGCLSEDTEILIDGRWEPYYKATEGSHALCYNADTDTYQWEPIKELVTYEYSDTAYRIESDSTDQIVSRNHRCLVERDGAYVFELAEEAARQRQARVPVLENLRGLLQALPVPHEGAGRPQQDVLKGLCGPIDFASKEGSQDSDDPHGYLPALRQGIRGSGLSQQSSSEVLQPGVQRSGTRERVGSARAQGARGVDQRIGSIVPREDERLEQSGMEGWGDVLPQARQLQAGQVCSLPGGIFSDGPQGRLCDGASFGSGAGTRAATIEVRGSAPLQPRPTGQPDREPSAVRVESGSQAVRASRYTRSDLAQITPIHYTGTVWCVRVPSGAFVARRNGKVFVTGNSGFPKSHNVSKAIDKAAGAEWDGWGTALKPAHEIVLWAQKPYSFDGGLGIITQNLLKLEAQLWSLLPVSIAVENFESSQSEYDAACVFAQWSADERGSIRAALLDQMDMSQFVSAMTISLNIVSSWRNTLNAILNHGNTFTTEMESSLITDLKTLNSLVLATTPEFIIQAAMTADGSVLTALPVVKAFSAAEMKFNSILELSALANATGNPHTFYRAGEDQIAPNSEPVIVARKPFKGTVANNVLQHGTGALNIDASRISVNDDDDIHAKNPLTIGGFGHADALIYGGPGSGTPTYNPANGRWPANVILDEEAAALLDEQTGTLTSGKVAKDGVHRRGDDRARNAYGHFNEQHVDDPPIYGDSGGASRFFYVAKAPPKERYGILTCDCQAGKIDEWENADQNQSAQMDVTSPPRDISEETSEEECGCSTAPSGNKITDPSRPDIKSTTSTKTNSITESKTSNSGMGNGGNHAQSVENSSRSQMSTGTSVKKGGLSTGDVAPVTSLKSSTKNVCETCGAKLRVVSHPTQKPITLMRYLVRLVTPPGGVVLDPFVGSGTTMLACLDEGFLGVGIDLDTEDEYLKIAIQRIKEHRS